MAIATNKKAVAFDPRSAQRIADAVKVVEAGETADMTRDATDTPLRSEFWAVLTDIALDTNFYKYSWAQIVQYKDDWKVRDDGLTGDKTDDISYAINTIVDDDATVDTVLAEFPAPIGLIVRMRIIQYWDADTLMWKPSYRFQVPTPQAVPIKISSAVTGQAGKYHAKTYRYPIATGSGALAESDLGTLAIADNVIVWNVGQAGGGGASIPDGTDIVGWLYNVPGSPGAPIAITYFVAPYTGDEVWIDVTGTVISHIGPSTITSSPDTAQVTDGGVVTGGHKYTFKFVESSYDGKGHYVSTVPLSGGGGTDLLIPQKLGDLPGSDIDLTATPIDFSADVPYVLGFVTSTGKWQRIKTNEATFVNGVTWDSTAGQLKAITNTIYGAYSPPASSTYVDIADGDYQDCS